MEEKRVVVSADEVRKNLRRLGPVEIYEAADGTEVAVAGDRVLDLQAFNTLFKEESAVTTAEGTIKVGVSQRTPKEYAALKRFREIKAKTHPLGSRVMERVDVDGLVERLSQSTRESLRAAGINVSAVGPTTTVAM